MFEVIVEDITETHRLHEQLRQAQKMEAIGQLAGGVAHDFNNMLTAILGYSEMLTEQIGPDKPIGRDLHEIAAAAKTCGGADRQLLAFSRQQVLAMAAVDLTRRRSHRGADAAAAARRANHDHDGAGRRPRVRDGRCPHSSSIC